MKDVIIESISKSFKKEDKKALDQISLEVEEGELFGLIGPDGAGKTTLFRILTTLLLADSGNAYVHGKEVVKDYKKNPQYDRLHAWKNSHSIRIYLVEE